MTYDLDKMINGQFDYEREPLVISVPRLELEAMRGGICSGSFEIRMPEKTVATGRIYASGVRMNYAPEEFTLDPMGRGGDLTVQYEFDTTGLNEGDVQKGEFTVISNLGEYMIPFVVTVAHSNLETSMGSIHNLFHFTNLAKMNWPEALTVFYSPHFSSILTGNDRNCLPLYQGLVGMDAFRDGTNEQNMEEFLVAINKKSLVEFDAEEKEREYDSVFETIRDEVKITRNGWGYTNLKVHCEGDFLSTEKAVLTDNDFLGNVCTLRYYIDPERLHGGNNPGRIVLSNAYTTLAIRILVRQKHETIDTRRQKNRRKLDYDIVEAFIRFRSRKLGLEEWVQTSNAIIDEMLDINQEDPYAQMYRVQLLITQGKTNEAKWLIGRVEDQLQRSDAVIEPEGEAYYYYLTTLLNREEEHVNTVCERVERMYAQDPDNWRISWLLLYLKEEYTRNPEKRMEAIRRQFYRESNSPVLYIEAYTTLSSNPLLLTQLDDFNIRVLVHACRMDILKQELIDQILYLTGREHSYSDRIFYILRHCYKLQETEPVLTAIIGYLIAGNRLNRYAFSWYAKGVEANLRVTGLYEYYMMSIDPESQDEIPRMVLMYFSYHCDLPYDRKAMLYDYITERQDEYADISAGCEEELQQFLLEQIRHGRMNKHLASLYKKRLDMSLLDEELAECFVPLIFMNLVTVETPFIRDVVLIQEKFSREYVYPLTDGKAMFPIYSSSFKILLQDDEGNRYVNTIPYKLEKMMLPGKPGKAISPLVRGSVGFDIYLYEESRSFVEIDENNVDRFLFLMTSALVSADYKRAVRRKLADYYYRNDMIEELDAFLEDLRPEGMDFTERSEFVRYMCERGMYDKALSWVKTYGPEEIPERTLLHLASHLISRSNYEYDEYLVRLAAYVYHLGKSDEVIIKYLIRYYVAGIRELKKLRKAAAGYGTDLGLILERLLVQGLYSGAYTGDAANIYMEYIKGNPKPELEQAFLAYSAYQYFVKDSLIDPVLILTMQSILRNDGPLPEPCKLAVLKYYAENRGELKPEMHPVIKGLLQYCQRQRYIFRFLTEYADIFPGILKGSEKTYIEYKTNPANKVVVHYLIEQDGEKRGEYRMEEMPKVYDGICVKGFILFFGESLQYYITETRGEEEQLVESGSLRAGDRGAEGGHTEFDQLNDISIGLALQDYETAQAAMDEYLRQKYLKENLFKTI